MNLQRGELILLVFLCTALAILGGQRFVAGGKNTFNGQYVSRDVETYHDRQVITALQVARFYGLSREQAIVLVAIRDHENGGPGKEFGIEIPSCRFRDGRHSFVDNCATCCEIILARCPDGKARTLRKLNKSYAADPNWWRGVRKAMARYRNIIY